MQSDPSLRQYRIYLAGPEVFLPDPLHQGEEKKAILRDLCAKNRWPFTLSGLYPMDNDIDEFRDDPQTAQRIYHANLELMDRADAIAANMVRFRGPSMDVGTAFEMGYMASQRKPVFGYYEAAPFYGEAEHALSFQERVSHYWGTDQQDPNRDKDGQYIENFGLTDNLMMVGAHTDTGFAMAENFEQAILNIAQYFLQQDN